MKRIILFCIIGILIDMNVAAQRYVGGDISLLPEYEQANAKYKDHEGKPISDLVPWLKEEGMNAMRIRLFVNPKKYSELHPTGSSDVKYDPNACQDLEYIIPLCKRIQTAGLKLMLDFHYSDTWADPAKQWTPVEWEGLSDEQLYEKIYNYTRETLLTLRDNGIVPEFIQPGNEISYGMLWGPLGTNAPKKTFMGNSANWDRLGKLLRQAVKACGEICPDAKIVLHTERVAQVDVQNNFYNMMRTLGVEYDIIGLSYYPYFHGPLTQLEKALSSLQTNFPDKDIMIVETGYAYKWAVPGTSVDMSNLWPYTDAGQDKFAKDLVSTLEKYNSVNGLFWWWMEYNAYGTGLQGWYNAPLFDSTNGCATSALKTICSFATPAGVNAPTANRDCNDELWYDLGGNAVTFPSSTGIYIHKGKKVIVK